MRKTGFDQQKYVLLQSQHIRERIQAFGGKLYLEFGGKLFDDYHASRVVPGFAPDTKIRMLMELRDQAEILLVINASDIEKNKIRGDLGIPYDMDVLRLIDAFREKGLYVGSVVITRYERQPAAVSFANHLRDLGVPCYYHYPIPGYPADVQKIMSSEGCGKNDYVPTTRPLVVVTAPGPGSGKMATCLSQLYHENLRGVQAGYAKFETFPVWNLPLDHPVNLAYEAATTDLDDANIVDPFHLKAYNKIAVNYNRDVEIFPVLDAMFESIYGESPYKSPTDMGVNMIGCCISDDEAVRYEAGQEIIRRYYRAMVGQKQGLVAPAEVDKMRILLKQAGLRPEDRPVVAPALRRAEETGGPAAAIELPDGTIVTGKSSELLGAASATLMNALKVLGGIRHSLKLISPVILEPIQHLKVAHLGNRNPQLHTDELLLALSICAATNPVAEMAMEQLSNLQGCEMHSTVIISQVDKNLLGKLGIQLTCEPVYQSNRLYHK